jgi:hypothetical protein
MTIKSPVNISNSGLVRVATRYYKDDYEYIQLLAATNNTTATRLLRAMLRNTVCHMRAKERELNDKIAFSDASEAAREMLKNLTDNEQ